MSAGRGSVPDAIVHIGTAKTGTTTLQSALLAAADRLAPRGVAYLPSPGAINARELAAASVGDDGFDDHLDAVGATSPAARNRFRHDVEQRFARQVAEVDADTHTVVISSEHLHSRLVQSTMVERFRSLISPYVGEVRIVCYLRPQTDLVASFHSTHVRNGGTDTFAETNAKMLSPDSPYTNYERLLDAWASAFGESAIEVRIFDRGAFVGGSILEDFAGVLGLPGGVLTASGGDSNQSIGHLGQLLLGELNRAARAGRVDIDDAAQLRNAIADSFTGAGERLTGDEATEAQSRFDRSNEAVRIRFRPDLPRLFPAPSDSSKPFVTPAQAAALSAVIEACTTNSSATQDPVIAPRRRLLGRRGS